MGILFALAKALEARDDDTASHSMNVTKYAMLLGRQLGLDDEEMRILGQGAMLHDLGWPTLQSRRRLNSLSIFYKAVNHLIAIPLNDDCLQPTRVTRKTSGSSRVFTPIGCACDAYKFSFYPRTIRDWNGLSDNVRNSKTVEIFNKAASAAVLTFY